MKTTTKHIVFGRELTWLNGKNVRKDFTSFEDYYLANTLSISSYSKEKFSQDLRQYVCQYINDNSYKKNLTPDTIDLMDIDRFLSTSNNDIYHRDPLGIGMDVGSVFRLADVYKDEMLNMFLDHAYLNMKETLRRRSIDYLAYFFCCRSDSFIRRINDDFCWALLTDLNNQINDLSNDRCLIAPLASYVYIWKRLCGRIAKTNTELRTLTYKTQEIEKRLMSYQLKNGSWPADNMDETGDVLSTCMVIHALYTNTTIERKETLSNARAWLQTEWRKNKKVFGKDPAFDIFCIESLAMSARENPHVTIKNVIRNETDFVKEDDDVSELENTSGGEQTRGVSNMEKDEDNASSQKTMGSNSVQDSNQTNTVKSIFISHRSSDKELADHLYDFLIALGVPDEAIFCSSLPGNDVHVLISAEVKQAMKTSKINILILSEEYYKSAYCLHEAGVIWYLDQITAIPIVLPEITPEKMYGFLNSEYKARKLDNRDDIAYISDTVAEVMGIQQKKMTKFNRECTKLMDRYTEYLDARVKS